MTGNTLEQRAAHIEMLEWMLENLQSHGFSCERAALTAAIAALRLSAGADWVLVPSDPTEAMIEAAWESDATSYVGEHKCIISASDAYRAMLAAAPRHEPGEGS